MKKKIIHIVPENRLGGIFTYIQRLTFYNRDNYEHYLFRSQPKLKKQTESQIQAMNHHLENINCHLLDYRIRTYFLQLKNNIFKTLHFYLLWNYQHDLL